MFGLSRLKVREKGTVVSLIFCLLEFFAIQLVSIYVPGEYGPWFYFFASLWAVQTVATFIAIILCVTLALCEWWDWEHRSHESWIHKVIEWMSTDGR
jgi:hypothetical protein